MVVPKHFYMISNPVIISTSQVIDLKSRAVEMSVSIHCIGQIENAVTDEMTKP